MQPAQSLGVHSDERQVAAIGSQHGGAGKVSRELKMHAIGRCDDGANKTKRLGFPGSKSRGDVRERCQRHGERSDWHSPTTQSIARTGRHRLALSRVTFLLEPGQLHFDVMGCLPALVRILGEARLHDAVERRWRKRLNIYHRRRMIFEDGADDGRGARPAERLVTRRHLIQQRTECENVGPRIGRLSFELLGRHVLQRAENRTLASQGAVFGDGRV